MGRMMRKKLVIRRLRGNEFFPTKRLIRSNAKGDREGKRERGRDSVICRERTRKFLYVYVCYIRDSV